MNRPRNNEKPWSRGQQEHVHLTIALTEYEWCRLSRSFEEGYVIGEDNSSRNELIAIQHRIVDRFCIFFPRLHSSYSSMDHIGWSIIVNLSSSLVQRCIHTTHSIVARRVFSFWTSRGPAGGPSSCRRPVNHGASSASHAGSPGCSLSRCTRSGRRYGGWRDIATTRSPSESGGDGEGSGGANGACAPNLQFRRNNTGG